MKVEVLPLGAYGTNCYILTDEAQGICAVVDPGAMGDEVADRIKKANLTPAAVFLTHGHGDHTGGVRAFKAAFPGVPVYLHDEDYAMKDNRAAFMGDVAERTKSYGDGDEIPVGGLTVKVLHTPGHTPGGVTLQVEDVLFTGDTLFHGSMGRTDFAGGSYETIMASLRRLAELPGDYQVCPGHEGLSTLEAERRANYYVREALGR